MKIVPLLRSAAAARSAGALGTKLSGGGRGGNLIALVTAETAPRVADALRAAGAVRVIVTEVGVGAQPSESNSLAEPEKPPQRLTTSG